MKLNYLRLVAIKCTVQSLLFNKNKWNLKVLISDLLLFVFQFHILFAQLSIWKHIAFTLLRRLRFPLNLSSEQQKVSSELLEKIKCKSFLVWKFWSAWYQICSLPSWLWAKSALYIVPPRVELHSQLPSLLVPWSYRERNTHAIPYKCGGTHQLK